MPRKIAIEEATPDQLRAFAREYLGVNHPSHTKTETTLALIRERWKAPHILVGDESDPAVVDGAEAHQDEPAVVVETPHKFSTVSGKDDPRITINISEQEGPGGKRPVTVQVNGTVIAIPRNTDAEVPYRYFLALRQAVATVFEQDPDSGEVTSRDVHRYPHNVVKAPPQHEVDAWYAKQGIRAAA